MNPSKKRIRSEPFVPIQCFYKSIGTVNDKTTTKDKPVTKKSALLLRQAKNGQQLDKDKCYMITANRIKKVNISKLIKSIKFIHL
jgi:hypothetical protein